VYQIDIEVFVDIARELKTATIIKLINIKLINIIKNIEEKIK
jgi:hypothetical protein